MSSSSSSSSGFEMVQVAPKLGENYIWSLATFNGKIYGGTAITCRLYEWNGTNAWAQVAPQFSAEQYAYAMVVYNNQLYCCTGPNSNLLRWNGTNAWTQVAAKFSTEQYITSLVVFNNKIYGAARNLGTLLEWNGTNAWVSVAPMLNSERILSLVVFNNQIYCGTFSTGRLYQWNGTNAWIQVAPQLGSEGPLNALAIFNNKLYAGTSPSGKLYEWNGTNAWTEVAPQFHPNIGVIYSLIVYNNKLYATTGFTTSPSGCLLQWDGNNSWIQVAPTFASETRLLSSSLLNNYMYMGTGPNGNLLRFSASQSIPSTSSSSSTSASSESISSVSSDSSLSSESISSVSSLSSESISSVSSDSSLSSKSFSSDSSTSVMGCCRYYTAEGFASHPNANGTYTLYDYWTGHPSYRNSNGYFIYYGADHFDDWWYLGTNRGAYGDYYSGPSGQGLACPPEVWYGYHMPITPEGKLYCEDASSSSRSSVSSQSLSSFSSDSSSGSSNSSWSSDSSDSSSSSSLSSDSSDSSSSASSNSSSSTFVRSSSSSSSSSASTSSSSSGDIIKLYGSDVFTYIQEYTDLQFKYMDGDNTFATMILDTTPFLIGNVSGEMVWDYNGSGQVTLSDIGNFAKITVGHRTYTITFLGYGSLWFSILAVEADNKTVPFVFEVENITPIWSLTSYGNYIYAGSGPDGILLRSKDRFFWEEVYRVDDINIKSVYVQNDTLFIGTSPNGRIYTMNLKSEAVTLSQEIGNEVSGFIYYKNIMYASGGIPNQIWAYDVVRNQWNTVYQPYATTITKMLIFQDKLYLVSNNKNIVSFDGKFWKLESKGVDNVASIRGVPDEPYSHLSNGNINRPSAQRSVLTDIFRDEDIYDIYPENYSAGLKSADVDGDSLVVGTLSHSKIYNLIDGIFYPVFQTEQANTIHYLLNIAVGVNLAAIDNKLYLIHCGDLPSDTAATTTRTTTRTTTLPALITLIYPQGGENLVSGDAITIQWNSTTSINDVVKIELYKGKTVSLIINPSTSNDGSYAWSIPSMIPGSDYKIVLTWLSASADSKGKTAESGFFNIWTTALPTTTTTTTTAPSSTSKPQTSNSRGIPLLELAKDEYITYMMKDVAKGGILFATSQGRVLGCQEALVNAYLTGNRNVYAEVMDGFGNISETAWTTFFYALYNKIVKINEQKEITRWRFEVKPTAICTDRITGTFLSPILSVKEDLDFWKQLIWKEDKPENTKITICIRASDSIDELQVLPWDFCFASDESDANYGSPTEFITRELNSYQIRGKYLQFKVVMSTDAQNISPSILSLVITYSTKFATYFFTTKFALQNQSNVKSGLIVANMTEPQNTEVRFGIVGTNSADWNDYEVVEPNKLFSLNDIERMKIGIKMITYDTNVPEVAEFSLLTGSEKDNTINE